MITQKQIDTRDEYINLLNAEVAYWAGFLHAHRCFSEHAEQGRRLRKAIADADWESCKTKIADADKETYEEEEIKK